MMKDSLKKKLIRRLKILEGQIRGLQKMVINSEYCVDILRQSSAAKEALSSFEDAMLENHLSTHVVEQIKRGNTKKAIKEILTVYKASKTK